jgi:hypothetical protein
MKWNRGHMRLDRRMASALSALVRSHDYALLCFSPASR